MKTRMVTLIAALALSGASLAYADHRPGGDYDDGRYNGNDRGPAYGQSDYDTARVVHVEPLSRRIRVLEPRRECRLETVYNGGYSRDRYNYRDRGGDVRTTNNTIIGGLIGGAIGNQIGRGEGRSIATVAGALIGAAVGHDTARRGRDDRYGDRYDDSYDDDRGRSREVERCRVRQEERFEERIDGYRVTYVYNGREYTTRMSYDPGPQLRVRVRVSPEQSY